MCQIFFELVSKREAAAWWHCSFVSFTQRCPADKDDDSAR